MALYKNECMEIFVWSNARYDTLDYFVKHKIERRGNTLLDLYSIKELPLLQQMYYSFHQKI